MTEKEIIIACKQQDRKAQKMLFEKYSPKMYGICKRYIKDHQEAEDVLVEGMYKVMTKIEMYKGDGSFEGWIRKIIVNQALMYLRKRNELRFAQEIDNIHLGTKINAQNELEAQDILNLLNELPTGYRTIFNLYVIEGYKHREIAEQLGISINTSKSQLILAKKRMKELIQKNSYLT